MFHIGIEVDGEPVEGDPFADAHADGADLCGIIVFKAMLWIELRIDPDAGGIWVCGAGDVVGCEGIDDRLFEETDVVVDAELCCVEIDDGVGDELAGAVVGDIASAIGLMEGDALRFEE